MQYLLIPMDSVKTITINHAWSALPMIEIEAYNFGLGTMDLVDPDVEPYVAEPRALPERRPMLDG